MSLSKPAPKTDQTYQNPADLVHYAKYTNTLPDPPFDGKFLKCNKRSLAERFSNYTPISMETTQRKLNMCDMDVGVHIDMVDPATYKISEEPVQINEKDAYLLEDESKESLLKSKRSAQHANIVPFMRRTEYISAEFNRMGTGADRQETKVGYSLFKKGNTDGMFYRDRESQIEAINKTFEDVKKPVLKHHSKPGVTAVEECFILPDFDNWEYHLAQVLYDADPSYAGVPENLQKECIENSVIMMSDEATSSVGLFCPSVSTLQTIMEDEEAKEKTITLGLNREYTWNVRPKAANFEDDYVLVKRGDKYFYNDLEMNVKLARKRIPAGEKKPLINCELSYREFSAEEKAVQEKKKKKLFNTYEEEEEEEEMEQEEEKKEEEVKETANETKGSGSSSSSAASSSGSSSSGSDSD